MKVEFKGGRKIQLALRNLEKQTTARAVARRALLRAAEPIRDQAKQNAPDDPATGTGKFLVESIKAASSRSRDKDVVQVAVGIDQKVGPPKTVTRKRGSGSYRDPGVAGVAVIMEFGAPARNIAPTGFMRRALEVNKAATPGRIAEVLREEVDKAAARQAKRAARQ